jgi:hypothetical protein
MHPNSQRPAHRRASTRFTPMGRKGIKPSINFRLPLVMLDARNASFNRNPF